MNRTYLTFLLLLGVNLIFSQEKDCKCIDELNNVSHLIENSKSYKIQVKRADKEADFRKWQEEIKQEISNDRLSKFFCIGYLQKYISYIKDRHNQIYSVPDSIALAVPEYPDLIDTLQITNDEISGIYFAGAEKILVKKENDSLWYGIILESDSDQWSKGKIRLRINKTSDGELELFEFFKNGLLLYQKNIVISEGRIHSTFWNKDNKYYFNKNHNENFTYKSLDPSFDYIGIKTLKRTNKLIEEADNFYKKIMGSLTRENLIVDLRNNGGGAVKQAKPLLKLLRRNDAIKKIYVLINFKTASAAELIALELKEDERTILAGENSSGTLEYGYGNSAFSTQTSCKKYKLILSTKQVSRKLSEFEYRGITPEYYLDNTVNWIDQILNLEAVGK